MFITLRIMVETALLKDLLSHSNVFFLPQSCLPSFPSLLFFTVLAWKEIQDDRKCDDSSDIRLSPFHLPFLLASVSDIGNSRVMFVNVFISQKTHGLQWDSDDLKVWCVWLAHSSLFSTILWLEKEIKVF